MPITDDVIWMCIVETPDKDRHIMKLSGVRDEATIRRHAEQINPANKILVLQRATLDEIQQAADRLNADPSHLPITDMNNYVPQESGPIAPAASPAPAPAAAPLEQPAPTASPASPPKTFA